MRHSPEPISESRRPATLSGSIGKTRQNHTLAAMMPKSPAGNSNGSLDAATIASDMTMSMGMALVRSWTWPSGTELTERGRRSVVL